MTSHVPAVEVRDSPRHGRGLYATRALRVGEVATEAPALLLDADETDALAEHLLASYLVAWDDERTGVPFGVVSFTNHDDTPNAQLVVDHDRTVVQLVVTRRVRSGDELTIDYGEDHPV